MLFQPTNITPDVLGSTGNGTVDPTTDFSVSWQVNGNSPMVAFQIDIYPNTSTTTVTYSTGKLTTGCPFSGTNSLGVRQTFTYTSSSSFATLLGASSGEYKMIITQWWGATDADSVVQSSPSVFELKSAPTLTLTTPNVTTRDYTFTATYSQANGDVLNWVRWEIGVDKAYSGSKNLLRGSQTLNSNDWVLSRASIAGNILTLTPTTSQAGAQYKSTVPYPATAGKKMTIAFDARPIAGSYDAATRVGVYMGASTRPNNVFSASYDKYSPIGYVNFIDSDWERYEYSIQVPDDMTGGTDTALTGSATFTFYIVNGASKSPVELKNFVMYAEPYSNETGTNIQMLYDSGNIYGTSELSCEYDGFFTNTHYVIKCTVETESGVQATTGWVPFVALYSMSDLDGTVTARKLCNGKSAIDVEWNGYTYIVGEPSAGAEYTFDNGFLNIKSGTITWDTVNGVGMSLETPWNILFKTTLTPNSDTLLEINTVNDDITFAYSSANAQLTLTAGADVHTYSGIHYDDTVSLIVTPDMAYIRIDGLRGGLYPDDALYPEDILYPRDDTIPTVYTYSAELTYTQGNINEIIVSAEQIVEYIQEVTGVLPADVINSVWQNGDYEMYGVDGTMFMTHFATGGLDAGSLFFGDTEIIGWAVYRMQAGSNILKHITDAAVATSEILDYSACSQQGEYTYYIYPIGDNKYISDTMHSEGVNPCFWDWTILECEKIEENRYSVINEFTFGKNLSSGNISNSNTPNIMENFTAYPTVQLSPQNYKAGTLESLIGKVQNAKYSDTIELRNAILQLSTTTNPLFLKSRKGDLMQIRISGAISFSMMDNSKEQATSVSIPWVEVADASNASIIG